MLGEYEIASHTFEDFRKGIPVEYDALLGEDLNQIAAHLRDLKSDPRSEVRSQAEVSSFQITNIPGAVNFVIDAESIDALPENEWIELLALKMLNRSELRILIRDETGSHYSDRSGCPHSRDYFFNGDEKNSKLGARCIGWGTA